MVTFFCRSMEPPTAPSFVVTADNINLLKPRLHGFPLGYDRIWISTKAIGQGARQSLQSCTASLKSQQKTYNLLNFRLSSFHGTPHGIFRNILTHYFPVRNNCSTLVYIPVAKLFLFGTVE